MYALNVFKVIQPAGEWASAPEVRRAESSASLEFWKRTSFYMPVCAIRGLFSQLLTVPLYRQPNTLGWPYLDAPIDPGDQWSSDTFLPLRNLLMLLPNFMPSAVQELLQTFQINGTHFYNLSALTHLREKGILPGTRSDDMSLLYDWPLEWEPRASLLFNSSL